MKFGVSEEDVKTVARTLKVDLTQEQLTSIINKFEDNGFDTWYIVVEDLIYEELTNETKSVIRS